ncbi:DUF2515 family protein [Paenibacillus chondroitinus]|uniref:DUF2515 family protein n=1 Tax=Paenibacillus chondroitinus TaxID=59842 RepID=A0ABU6D3Q6_9BACL|nr:MULTISPECIES: DUF2515 family protein [Paenibacillus]MCY9660861.1 DUF2515 domain-containing protein [Paenibacillus anseongense]MEB4792341.1 DUF2515 family protein [Paenibacillus chondroitinus]
MRSTQLEIIPLSKNIAERLEKGLTQQLELLRGGVQPFPLTAEETRIVEDIRARTRKENRNNVTRTMAYWACYQKYPELHWALLAHMVSRNGGWNMTDLHGDLLPHLIDADQAEHLFAFLERANGLIFQDAYPQLLLYDESKKREKNLFHLLPHLNISIWMIPVWHEFWTNPDSTALTIALIVNEQNYIEQRIVQKGKFRETVLDKTLFKAQGWMQLNQIAFPFWSPSAEAGSPQPRLAGLILENFTDLAERIALGKGLYALLIGVPEVLQGVLRFAASTPHTGSRADYWPHLFTPIQKAPPDHFYQERLDGCFLKKGSSPLYSPTLETVWPDRPLLPVEPGDWFQDVETPMGYMHPIKVPQTFDLTQAMSEGLNSIELAILAAQAMNVVR